MTTYAQLAGNAFTPSEVADPAATVTTNTGAEFVVTSSAHAGWSVHFFSVALDPFTYSGTTPIDGTVDKVELWNGATVAARFTSVSGADLALWWTNFQASGAKTAFNSLFFATDETGDANSNALETYGFTSTLAGNGGADRYEIGNGGVTVNDGNDGSTFNVNAFVTFTVNGSGGNDTLVSNISQLDFTGTNRQFGGVETLTFGTGATKITIETGDLTGLLIIVGNAGANEVVLKPSAGVNTFSAASITFQGFDGSDKVTMDWSTAGTGVDLTGPGNVNTSATTGSGNDTVTLGSGNDSCNLGAGTDSCSGGAGIDTLVYLDVIANLVVTQLAANTYKVSGPAGDKTCVDVEFLACFSGVDALADQAGPPPPPPPPVNQPPKLNGPASAKVSFCWPTKYEFFQDVQPTFIDPDGDKLTVTLEVVDPSPLLPNPDQLVAWISIVQGSGNKITLSGKPPEFLWGESLKIKIKVSDGKGGETSEIFDFCFDDVPFWDSLTKPLKASEGQKTIANLNEKVFDSDVTAASGSTKGIETAMAEATAPDFENQILTFSIIGGPDKGDFKLTENGILKFKKKPDFEKPKDSNHDNTYKVEIAVSDGFFSDEGMFKIKVKNKAEAKAMAMEPEAADFDHAGELNTLAGLLLDA